MNRVARRPAARRPAATATGWQALFDAARRAERPVLLLCAAMLTVVAAVAVAAPRLLARAEAESLDLAIEQAPTAASRLSIQVIDEFDGGSVDDPLLQPLARVDAVAEDIDRSVLDRFGPPRLVADTNRFQIDGAVDRSGEPVPPALATYVTFRVHPELDEHSTLVAGRDPEPTDATAGDLPVFEFAVTPAAVEELGWVVGTRLLLGPDATDLVTRQFNGGLPDPFVAELVGLRELSPEDDPYWAGDPRLHRPTVADTNAGANVFVFAIASPAQMPGRPFQLDGRGAFALEQRRDLVPGAVDLDTVRPTLAGLTALATTFADQPTLSRPGVSATLGPVLAEEVAQQEAARSTLVVAATGVLGVVLATLGQLLVVSYERRRPWLTVARARGASRSQVTVAAVAEMAALAAAACALGWAVAAVAVGGAPTATELALLAGLWLGAVAAAGLTAWTEALRPVAIGARSAWHPGLGRWSRIGGVVLVAAAVAALVTFRRRGFAADRGADLLTALVPVVVPLAIVYATGWVLPAVTRRISRRGLAMAPGRLVGLRRVAGAPLASTGIVTVLVLALTVAALGLAVDRSVEAGAVDASWIAVGAPARLQTRDEAVADAVRALPGATIAATGSTRVNLDRGDSSVSVQLATLDVVALQALTAGTAADQGYPAALAGLDAEGRVPVVAAERIGGERVRRGDLLVGAGARAGQVFVVIETRPEALGRRTDWLLADRAVVAALAGVDPAFNSLAIDVPADEMPALRAIAAESDATLVERQTVLDQQRADPLSRTVRRGYVAVAVLALVLAVLSVVAIAVVTARQRRREVAILALLGADAREVGRAVAAELVPPALAGVVTGSLVGWFVVVLFDGRYDLSAFAGGSQVAIRPAPLATAAVAAAVAVVAVAVIVALTRRIVAAPVGELLRVEGAA